MTPLVVFMAETKIPTAKEVLTLMVWTRGNRICMEEIRVIMTPMEEARETLIPMNETAGQEIPTETTQEV